MDTQIFECGLLGLIGNRLRKQSLTHECLCPVCNGEGGPCKTCNGYGIIVDSTKPQSLLTSPIHSPKAIDKIEQ